MALCRNEAVVPNVFSRRRILRVLGGSTLTAALDGTVGGQASAIVGVHRSIPSFEEIPPSASGISWIHANGQSPSVYLLETVGAGCAFVDYDDDDWMDIYPVNSGACEFYNPAGSLRNAL
jgi:hypothetical protein